MSQPTFARLPLLGATGYIGGAVLDHLLESDDPLFATCQIPILVRGEDRIIKLRKLYGSRIVVATFSDLEDIDVITRLASEHDVVVNSGTGFHSPSAEALVRGLAQLVHDKDKPTPWIIHLSGGSNVAYVPLTQESYPEKRLSLNDADLTAIFDQETALEAIVPYPQRIAELAVLAACKETGVHAICTKVTI